MNSLQNSSAPGPSTRPGGTPHPLVLVRLCTGRRCGIGDTAHDQSGPMGLFIFVDRRLLIDTNHVDIEDDGLREAVPEQPVRAPPLDYEFMRTTRSNGSAAFARCAGNVSQSPSARGGSDPDTGQRAQRKEHGDGNPESLPGGVAPSLASGGVALRVTGVDASFLRSSSTCSWLGSSGFSSSWWPGSGSGSSC